MRFSLLPLLFLTIGLCQPTFSKASSEIQPQEPMPHSSNRLAASQSPYLLQHADNPVNWYPWGDEAFEAARTQNKPVLISIGYSTCHWCHVMNRESFSNTDTATYLNEHFICIKVDREERPDVDRVYMKFVQQLTGSGGWPLNVWLTPDRKPIYGGTYFPPQSQAGSGRPSFPDILSRIHDIWTSDQDNLLAQTDRLFEKLNHPSPSNSSPNSTLDNSIRIDAINAFHSAFDELNGGFGGEPKFPSPGNLTFLLHAAIDHNIPEEQRTAALDMATTTLEKIAAGGIRDHIGGGFHRYAVDRQWKLPHYEKMLYDQALLVSAYLDAWLINKNPTLKDAAHSTLNYLLRDMQDSEGGFFSAEDAESIDPLNPSAKREGAFYVWSWDEFAPLLNDDSLTTFARDYYTLTQPGNSPQGPYHTEDLQGFNTLRREIPLEELATQHALTLEQAQGYIDRINQTLFDERTTRTRPHLDDKIIVAWNGLAISALARGAQHLDEPRFAAAAAQAATFIKTKLYNSNTHTLTRLYRNAPSTVQGFADDYAFLITGLIDLYEGTANPAWLIWAQELQDKQIELFYDQEQGGFYSSLESPEIVFARSKDDYDGAIPSINSNSTNNLARLAQILGNETYAQKARQSLTYFSSLISRTPRQMPSLLDAIPRLINSPTQIVIAGNPNSEDTQALLKTINSTPIPNRILLYADSGPSQEFLAAHHEFLKTVTPIKNKATAYICENFVCQLPATNPKTLEDQLNERALQKHPKTD